MRLVRRAVSFAAVCLLLLYAQPAFAVGGFRTLTRTTWAYIDLRHPSTSYVDTAGDAPVGLWRDPAGKAHLSKSYFTFDLTSLRGVSIKSATVSATETHANNCHLPRAVELWRTSNADQPTWINQPVERVKVADADPDPCLSAVHWQATEALQDAVATGEDRITFALRISKDRMFNPNYGRRYASGVRLTVQYNAIPDVPTELSASPGMGLRERPCGAEPLYFNTAPEVSARLTDGDTDNVQMQVALWPQHDPANRTELEPGPFVASGSIHQRILPADLIADDTTYAWAARAGDAEDWSAWSTPCLFHTDFTAPSTTPSVASTDYPERISSGGVGITGTFHVSANGDQDIVRFAWRHSTCCVGGEFDADQPGGSGSFQWTPTRSGPFQSLTIVGLDRAGNASPPRVYQLWVAPAPAAANNRYPAN